MMQPDPYSMHGLRYCDHCRSPTPTALVRTPGPNHVVHALISIFTCGLWLFVWLLIAILDKSGGTFPHCGTCGHRRLR